MLQTNFIKYLFVEYYIIYTNKCHKVLILNEIQIYYA